MKEFLLLIFFLGSAAATRAGQFAEPTDDEVWELVSAVSENAQALDAFDYDITMLSPEISSQISRRAGGLVANPEIHLTRHQNAINATVLLPELSEPLRSVAEGLANAKLSKGEVLPLLKEAGGNLLGSFLKAVEVGGEYDLVVWDTAQSIIEFNDLAEPLHGNVIRSMRITIDRERSILTRVSVWFGGSITLDMAVDLSPDTLYPGTSQPELKAFHIHQNGLEGRGPELATLTVKTSSYTRVEALRATDPLAVWKERLRGAGVEQGRIDALRVDVEGRLSLDLSKSSLTDLAGLHGMPFRALNLAGTAISDLTPLEGMPLRELSLNDTQVSDLSPLLDCPTLERLSVPVTARNIELLRKLPQLHELSYRWSARRHGPEQEASEFWQEFDRPSPK